MADGRCALSRCDRLSRTDPGRQGHNDLARTPFRETPPGLFACRSSRANMRESAIQGLDLRIQAGQFGPERLLGARRVQILQFFCQHSCALLQFRDKSACPGGVGAFGHIVGYH